MKYLFFFALFIATTCFSQENLGCKHFPTTNTSAVNTAISSKRGTSILLNNYDVKFYNIDLDVSNNSSYIFGFVEMLATSTIDNFNSLVVNLSSSFKIDSVIVNNKKCNTSSTNDLLTITLPTSVNKNGLIKSKIYYRGYGSTGADFPAGLINEQNDNGVYYTYTVSEPYHSYRWWPCKQELKDKADSVYINITTENTNTVASNGLLKKTTAVLGNKNKFEWKTYYPIDYYLITFSTGPYVVYNSYAKPSGSKDSILIQDFVYTTNDYTNNKSVIDKTKKLIELYSAKFGLYPFSKEKYGHFMTPSNIGALENQTMTMIGKSYNFSTVAHELSHQWFGDNVTCTSWQDIWLHEGFAEYFGQVLGSELYNNSPNTQAIVNTQTELLQNSENQAYLNSSSLSDPYAIFDHTNSYAKGAAVLHMLRFELGDNLFYSVLTEYHNKFKGKNASTDSLIAIVNKLTNKDYTYFFNQWIYNKGYPIYVLSYSQKGDTVYIDSKQSASSSSAPTFFNMKLDFSLSNGNSVDKFNFYQTKAQETFKAYYPGKTITNLAMNTSNWNLLKVNFIHLKSSECKLLSYSFNAINATASITGNNILITVPFGTDLTKLIASYTVSTYAKVLIGNVTQTSGQTLNDFTKNITYTIVAEDGTTANYTISITTTPASKEKDILSYSFINPSATGIINGTSISISLPYGTNVFSIYANFTLSNFATVTVNNNLQTSGSSYNNFTNPVQYIVKAQDGSTKTYTVTVIFGPKPKSSEKSILTFEFPELLIKGIVSNKTVNITVPYNTDISKLKAKFTLSTLAKAFVGNQEQFSETSINDYSSPLTYTVMAEDSSKLDYVINVTVGSNTQDNLLLEFGFVGFKQKATIKGYAVYITLPLGTNIKALNATWTISTNAYVRYNNETPEQSGNNSHDYTTPIKYAVIGSGPSAIYTVYVTLGNDIPKSAEKNMLTFGINNPKVTGVILDTNISITVPFGTNISNLLAEFTASDKTTVKVGQVIQTSGITYNDFTKGLVYTVIAEDGSIKYYSVTIKVANSTKSSEKNILSFGINSLKINGNIKDTNITLTVPLGTNVTNLIAEFTTSAKATATIGQVQQTSGVTYNDFTNTLIYTVIAEDGSIKHYYVSIIIDNKTTSISSIREEIVNVYPIPTIDKIIIESPVKVNSIYITNLLGVTVLEPNEINRIDQKIIIDVTQLASQTYFLHLCTSDENKIFKIEIQK